LKSAHLSDLLAFSHTDFAKGKETRMQPCAEFVSRTKMFLSSSSLPSNLRLTFVLVAYALTFWGLRVSYWATTSEAPFSDIADYVWVGQNIAHDFYFGTTDTFYSYYTPVTPSFVAIGIVLGGAHFEVVFRVVVQALAFLGSVNLAYEIVQLTRRGWLGAALLFVVALSRPSIFWSLKLSTESVSEALLLSSLGVVLRGVRTRSLLTMTLAGMLFLLLALNRPQFFPSVFLVTSFLAGRAARKMIHSPLGN
jgi:branched-subunit amino acid transport protein